MARPDDRRPDDYRHARREAVGAVLIWAAALAVTVGLSHALGRGEAAAQSLWGIPRWVALGVFAPWAVFFFIHVWFSLFFGRRRG